MNTLTLNQKLKRTILSAYYTRLKSVVTATFTGAVFVGAMLSSVIASAAEDEPMDLVDSVLAEGKSSLISSPTKLSSDFNVLVYGDGDYDSFLGKSEIWADNWGISAQLKQSDQSSVMGLPKDSSFFNLDVKRRFGNQDKSNIELGLGWQELTIDSQLDASGPKVSVAGKYNLLKDFQVYGSTSYFPELEDQTKMDSTLSAFEFEAGLLYKPLPYVSLKAGYRVFNLDLEDPILEELGSTSGFLLGTDLSW